MEHRVGIIMTPVSLTHSRKEGTKPNLGDLKISNSFALDCSRWDPAQTPTALAGIVTHFHPNQEKHPCSSHMTEFFLSEI